MLFNIIPAYMADYSESIRNDASILSRLEDDVASCVRVLGSMKGMENIIEVIRQKKEEISEESIILRNIYNSLNEITECYDWSENNVIREVDDSYVRYQPMRVSLQRTPMVSNRVDLLLSTISIV